MGSSSSKVVRKLPTRTKPSWGNNPPRPAPPAHPTVTEQQNLRAVDHNEKNPDFMSNLKQLGQVVVPNPQAMAQSRTATPYAQTLRHTLQVLQTSEDQAASSTITPNHLLASSLSELLDARKSVSSAEELVALAKTYKIEPATLERLARHINTPSVSQAGVTLALDGDGGERATMTAIWVDPVMGRLQKVQTIQGKTG